MFLAEKYENGNYNCSQGKKHFKILSSHNHTREKDNVSYTAVQLDLACNNHVRDSGDFGEYQACIVNGRTKNGRCGMVCKNLYYTDDGDYYYQPTVLPPELMCDGIQDCSTTNRRDVRCSGGDTVWCTSETGEDVTIPEMYLCDGSIHFCNSMRSKESDEDSSRCGRDRPGGDMNCPGGFLHPSKYCDGFPDCSYNEDEKRCNNSRAELYIRYIHQEGRLCEDPQTREVKYLYPEQICGNPTVYTGKFAPQQEQFRPCYNKFDQILCDTDKTRYQTVHGLKCVLNETLRTYLRNKKDSYFYSKTIDVEKPQLISKYLLCDGESDCEDGFDEVCDNPSTHIQSKSQPNKGTAYENNIKNISTQQNKTCFIHKHLICDGRVDCPEGEDELESLCDNDDWVKLTECERRTFQEQAEYKKTLLIHVSWIRDGDFDCTKGIDEQERQKKCPVQLIDGKEKIRSFEYDCEEVYKCSEELKTPNSYVEIPEMCSSNLDTCERHNRVCSAAKNKQHILTKPIMRQFVDDRYSTSVLSEIKYIAPCLPGLLKYGQFDCKTGEHHLLGSEGDLISEISNSTWVYENKEVFDCTYYFGENFLFLSCNDLCAELQNNDFWINYIGKRFWEAKQPEKCPFKHPEYQDDFTKKLGTTAAQVRVTARKYQDGSLGLVALERIKNSYHIRWFGCDNGKIILLNEVCDLENDCGDNSDEIYCSNSINCPLSWENSVELKTYPRIPFSSISNGKVDCKNIDEKTYGSFFVANDECMRTDYYDHEEFYMLGAAGFQFALSFGTLATVINLAVLFKNIRKLQKTATSSVLFGDSIYIFMISIGDFCVGVYLLLLAYHHREYDYNYCRKKYEWFSSLSCNALGVLSTFGSQISLFSMTIMSVQRARNLSCSLSFRFTRRLLIVYIILAIAAMALSITIAVAPLLDMFEDYFINGQVYYGTQERQIFLYGLQTKRDLISTIDAHYGSSIYKKLQTSGDTVRWSEVRRLFKGMFTNIWSNNSQSEVKGIQSAKVGFYGSGPACIFKFFVTKQDPQHVFSIAILSVNLACFLIITISYMRILQLSVMSNKAVGRKNENSVLLQTKVSMIILSDALCWIPFIIFAFLHFQEIENAEKHYVLFSVILLPVNSVVNPIIYHYNHNYTKQKFNQLWNLIRNSARGVRDHVLRESETTDTTVTTATTATSTFSFSHFSQMLKPKIKPSPCTFQVKFNVQNSTVVIDEDASVTEESETEIMEIE